MIMEYKKEFEITHESIVELSKIVDNDSEFKEVQDYLKSSNETIKVIYANPTTGGFFKSREYYLEGRRLTNGYVNVNSYLIHHVRNYNRLFKLKKSEEYKTYISLKDKYKEVDEFFKK